MLRAVLFDLHGTLLQDGPLVARLCAEAAAEEGLTLRPDALEAGLTGRALFHSLAKEQGRVLPEDALRRLERRIEDGLGRRLEQQSFLFPGAREIVQECARRVPLGLLADGPRRHATLACKQGGIFDRFSALLGVDDVPRRRPDPSGHLALLAALDRDLTRHGKPPLAPRHVLCVEDDEAGVAAAKAAGLRVVAVGHTTPQHRLARADAFVARLLDLSLDALSRELF